jgi:hypothetical protein
MKNIITGHFPSANIADPDIFYFNFNSRIGRTYKDGEITSYEAWIANEGLHPYVDTDNDGTLDIREPSYYTLENTGYTGGATYNRPAYLGQGSSSIVVPYISNPGPSLFNNSGQSITFIAEWNGLIIRFNNATSTFNKGSTVLLNDGDTIIYDIEKDTDGDGVRDAHDAFPNDPTEDTDADGDGVGANTDVDDSDSKRASGTDTDGDGTDDEFDNNPNDGPLGDSDGDGVVNQQDSFPNDPLRASGLDGDGDGIDNEFDTNLQDGPQGDLDGDGVINQDELDTDGDGTIDDLDNDDDNDGTPDSGDDFPLDSTEDTDTDGDGTGDNADDDDDGDGILDSADSDHPDNSGKPDTDGDGIIDEFDLDQTISHTYPSTANRSDGYLGYVHQFASSPATGSVTGELTSDSVGAFLDPYGVLTYNGGGTITILLNHAGDFRYNPAPQVSHTMTIIDDVTDSDQDGTPDINDPFPNNPNLETKQNYSVTWSQQAGALNTSGGAWTLVATNDSNSEPIIWNVTGNGATLGVDTNGDPALIPTGNGSVTVSPSIAGTTQYHELTVGTVSKLFTIQDNTTDTDGDGTADFYDASPDGGEAVALTLTPKFQGYNSLSYQLDFSTSNNHSSYLTGDTFNTDTTFTFEISKTSDFLVIEESIVTSTLAGVSAVGTSFSYIQFFNNLDSGTNYYARVSVTGHLEGSAEYTTPFITDPCDSFSATVTTVNGIENIVLTGNASTNVTVTEELPGQDLRGHVRPVANDEFDKLFIAIGEGSFQADGGTGGKLVLDGGMPKFTSYFDAPVAYGDNTWWSLPATQAQDIYSAWTRDHKATLDSTGNIYDSGLPGTAGYLYNAIRYIQRVDNQTNKILYINDYDDGTSPPPPYQGGSTYPYYAAIKFRSMFKDVSEHAGFTFEEPPINIGEGQAQQHNDWIKTGHSTKQDYLDFLNQYDCVIYMGVENDGYLPQVLIDAFLDYYDTGGGLFITTDHDIFQGGANQMIQPYGVQFKGNVDRNLSYTNASNQFTNVLNQNEKYRISSILANSNYIPGGAHPLFEGLSPNSFIEARRSEGELVYNDGTIPNVPRISITSNYTFDSSGNLNISSHNDGTLITNGTKIIISTSNDCGTVIT